MAHASLAPVQECTNLLPDPIISNQTGRMLGPAKRRVFYAGFALLLVFPLFLALYHATPSGLFARLIGPVPNSLADLRVDGHDWFGIAPEPVVRMRFSASPEDLKRLLELREATVLIGDAIGSGATGQAWWPGQAALGAMKGYNLKGRRRGDGAHFLWIDSTGTNAFYLLFGVSSDSFRERDSLPDGTD